MSDLGSRLKASLIPFYPFWEVEIGRSPGFDRNVAAEILSPVLWGSVCPWWGPLFLEKRSCLLSLKRLKGGTYLSKKKGKGKTPEDSALLHGMESLQVQGGQGLTVGKLGSKMQGCAIPICPGR